MPFEKPDKTFFRTQRIEKPWGFEQLWAWSESYAGKLLHVRAGESLSLQYHVSKDETLSLISGLALFESGASETSLESRELLPGDCVRLRPGTRHRITAIEDADFLEASTPELDDVVRLSDRYGRS